MRREPSSIFGTRSSGKLGAHEIDSVLTPEKLAVDDEGGHGKHALLLGFVLVALQLCGALAGSNQQVQDRGAVLVFELALEEARIGEIDQGAAMTALVGIEPGEMDQRLVEDLLGAEQGDAALVREATGVQVEVLDLAHAARDRLGIAEVDRTGDVEAERPER